MTPGRGTDFSRLVETEQNQTRLRGRSEPPDSRQAAPIAFRAGKHRGKTLTRGTKGTETQVAIYKRNGDRYVDTGVRVMAGWWYLNDGDAFEPGFKCLVEFFADGTWEITGIWCDEDDTEEDATPSPGTSPGYSPGESPGESSTEAGANEPPLMELTVGGPENNQDAIGGELLWQD